MSNKEIQTDTNKRGYSVKEAARYCGISADLLNKLRSQGKINGVRGPEFIKIGNKVIYTVESLDQWLASFTKAHSLAALSQPRLDLSK